MGKMNIDQVAKLAYVSRSVVSRVLNDHPDVSREARDRVLKVIRKYNYRPNSVARSLVTDRTYEISVLAPRRNKEALLSWIWPLLHIGISEQCIRRGYFVSLSMISADMEAKINERILYAHAFDGYILITQEVTAMVGAALRGRNVPAVAIGHDPAFPDFNSIDVDNLDGAYQATKHLVQLGHRLIAAVLGSPQMQETTDRRNGYLQALHDSGIPASDELIATGDYSQKSGYEITSRWMARQPAPTAIFCASDAIAMGCLLALHHVGRSVPGDVAVVGFDDLPGSGYTWPPLTTVRQPTYEKGEQAANILIDQIEGQADRIVHLQLRPQLVVRQTCGATRASA